MNDPVAVLVNVSDWLVSEVVGDLVKLFVLDRDVVEVGVGALVFELVRDSVTFGEPVAVGFGVFVFVEVSMVMVEP